MFEVAATANGVTYQPSTPIATPITGTTSPTAGTSSTSTPNGAVSISQLEWRMPLIVVCSMLIGAWSVT